MITHKRVIDRDRKAQGKYLGNRAEELFKNNIGSYIEVKLISNEEYTFSGTLVSISCNTFIIETNEGVNEMFRYEDVQYLISKNMIKQCNG